MHQSSGGWCVSCSGERKKEREWVICLHDHLLTVVGFRAGLDTPELSILQDRTVFVGV